MTTRRDSIMRNRAEELRDVRKALTRQVEAGELSWKGAFEKIYIEAFNKLSQPVKREPYPK